jgi:outer membrane autotransporter protein
VKSGSEIAESIDVPVTAQEANTLGAVIASNGNGTGIGNAIADAMSDALQSGNAAAAVQAAKELAPTTSQQVMGVAQGVNNVLSNVTGNRMSAMGRAGGDAFIGGALWVQGLYNHTKQDANASSDGFTANTRGIAFGIDGKVNEAVTLGLGYGYTNTNADAGNNDVDVDGHNVFAYAQYQPNAWYVNGMISYGLSKYTEEKAPMGIMMKSKYDVDTYSANLTTGYDFASGITPYAGLRYILAKQDAYSDGAQYIKSDDNDLLTGILGAKYSADIKTKDFTFAPNIRLAATYDFISDNSVANVNIIGGGNYQITGERLKRFGIETGVGVEATCGDWNLSLDYNGSFKKDFQSHTGMLKAKYNF